MLDTELAVSEMTEDERAIRELVDTWMIATKAGDLATVLDLMADDVIFMTPGAEPFGKEAFKTASESMSGAAMDGRAEVREIEVVGDWAWVRNHIEMAMIRPAAIPSTVPAIRSASCAKAPTAAGGCSATPIWSADAVDRARSLSRCGTDRPDSARNMVNRCLPLWISRGFSTGGTAVSREF